MNNIEYRLQWTEKYRPSIMEDIYGHNNILNLLKNVIKKKILLNMIFYGTPGTGKTTTIMNCARMLYKDRVNDMVLELNGSDDRGINVVRDIIKDFSKSKMLYKMKKEDVKLKLVILDEVDSMTYDAQYALRKIIETYSNNVRFCLICNYESKIITSIKSRCCTFRFFPLKKDVHIERLKYIGSVEMINMTDEGYNLIEKISNGDMRKSINLLQSVSMTLKNNECITEEHILKHMNYPSKEDINKMMNIIFMDKMKVKEKIEETIRSMKELNMNVSTLFEIIVNYIKSCRKEKMKIFDELSNTETYMNVEYDEELLISNIIVIVNKI